MKDIYQEALELHEKVKGKLEVQLKVPLNESHDLSLAYTPGVAQPCREIAKNKENVYKYTWKQNSVAVVSDGTAVLRGYWTRSSYACHGRKIYFI